MVAEGVKTSKVVMELAHEYGVSMPIAREVHRVVHEGSTGRRRVPRPAGPARRAGRDARHAQLLIRWRACASGPAPRAAGGGLGAARRRRPLDDRSGNLDSPAGPPSIRPGSSPSTARAWSLDWWIGAEDRWHVPAREAAVRQALVGNSPVVETRVRVPSGDAVHRVYAARGLDGRGGARRRGAERHARCPSPLALAIRPYDLDGAGRVDRDRARRAAGARRRRAGRRAARARRAAWRCRTPSGDAGAVVFAGRRRAGAAGRRPLRRRAGQRRPPLPARPHRHAPRRAPAVGATTSSTLDALPERRPGRRRLGGAHARRAPASRCPNRRVREARRGQHAGSCSSAAPEPGGGGRARPARVRATRPARRLLADAGRTAAPGRGAAPPSAAHWSLTRDLDVGAARPCPVVAALVARLARPGRRRRRGRSARPRCPASRRCSTRPASRGPPPTSGRVAPTSPAPVAPVGARPRGAARLGQPDLDVAPTATATTSRANAAVARRPSAACWSGRWPDGLVLSPAVPGGLAGPGLGGARPPDGHGRLVLRDPLARRAARAALGARAAHRSPPARLTRPEPRPGLVDHRAAGRGAARAGGGARSGPRSAAASPSRSPSSRSAGAPRERRPGPRRRAGRRCCGGLGVPGGGDRARPRTTASLVLLAIDKLALGQELRYDIDGGVRAARACRRRSCATSGGRSGSPTRSRARPCSPTSTSATWPPWPTSCTAAS